MARRAVQDVALDRMVADRVNLRIQINLMENSPLDRFETAAQRSAALSAARNSLAALEGTITEQRRSRCA